VKKIATLTLVVLLFLSFAFLGGGVSTANASSPTIFEFNVMTGVTPPYTGTTNAIRSIPGGGLPWVVGSAVGELKANGSLEIKVSGLVIDPNDPTAIARGLAGVNPSPNFKVIVSCLSKDADGNPSTVNVSSDLFPASADGNAKTEQMLALPHPCIAPLLFVTSPAGAWFASTGN